jgi:hypothetical protein
MDGAPGDTAENSLAFERGPQATQDTNDHSTQDLVWCFCSVEVYQRGFFLLPSSRK